MAGSRRYGTGHGSGAFNAVSARTRAGWAVAAAVAILLVCSAIGWQWFSRARPTSDFFSDESALKPSGPATGGGNQNLLYLAQMERGGRAAARGDYRQAARCYQRAIALTEFKSEPQRGLLLSLLSVSTRESPEAAGALAAELLKERPDDPALLMTFSDIAFLINNVYGEQGMEGALKRLEETLKARSEDPSLARYILVSAWLAAGRSDLARKEIERAVEAAPDDPTLRLTACQLAMAEGDWDAGLKHADRLQQLSPAQPEGLWCRAMALEHMGKTEQAKAIYQELTAKHSDLSLGYLGMSRILENARDYQGATRWIRLWLDRSPPAADTAGTLVRLLAIQGRAEEAVQWAETTLKATPPRFSQESPGSAVKTPAHLDAPAHEDSEEEDSAEEDISDPQLAVTLGTAAGFLDVGDLDRAETWAKRGEALAKKLADPSHQSGLATAQSILAQTYAARSRQAKSPALRRGCVDQAIEVYRSLVESSPYDFVAVNNLATLLQERGDFEGALAMAERLRWGHYGDKPLSGDRLPLEYLDTLGTVYRSKGQFRAAAELFDQASKRYAKEPLVFLHLGRDYAGLKQYPLARVQLNRAATLADERAKEVTDAAEKAKYQALAAEARNALKDLDRQP